MNERILELAIEARKYAETKPDIYSVAYDKKFAELLIQEMHRKVIASILITDVVMEEKGLTPTSEDYIRAINKDFGVEE